MTDLTFLKNSGLRLGKRLLIGVAVLGGAFLIHKTVTRKSIVDEIQEVETDEETTE